MEPHPKIKLVESLAKMLETMGVLSFTSHEVHVHVHMYLFRIYKSTVCMCMYILVFVQHTLDHMYMYLASVFFLSFYMYTYTHFPASIPSYNMYIVFMYGSPLLYTRMYMYIHVQ